MLHGQTAHKKSFFFASGRGSAMILGVSARSRTFPGGLCAVPSRPRGLSGRSWDVPGTCPDAPGTPAGSNERSLRSNFVQNCSKFQQNVVQLAQNVAKFDVLGSIFVLFRGCSACATRLAAQRAEPLFLLAGAVLSRVRRLGGSIQNRPKSSKIRSDTASRTSCA